LYNQVSFAADDLAVIKTLFGSENVFDFSGINEMTSHVENYYEDSHYRPHVARAIMNEIYRSPVLTKVR
jgi:hypothetical protein